MRIEQIPVESRSWVSRFTQKHGRAPRVLHIGNIANNAYNNSKLLIAAGIDCDVLCYDYYHLMGCPEWEDGEFDARVEDQFRPDWTRFSLGGFVRPKWFAQGPVTTCIDYLIARRSGSTKLADSHWRLLAAVNHSEPLVLRDKAFSLTKMFRRSWDRASRWRNSVLLRAEIFRRRLHTLATDRRILARLQRWIESRSTRSSRRKKLSFYLRAPFVLGASWVCRAAFAGYLALPKKQRPETFDGMAQRLVDLYAERFPDRADKLSLHDLEPYRMVIPRLAQLFKQYDIVQAYATDPILPLLASKRPYVAFEHGTLRTFTLRDDPVCRLTSLAYREADHVFITNGDCLEPARKIGVLRYTPMLHPVDERRIRAIPGDYEGVHREFGVRLLFLCTLRHDWAIKGTDKYILALPRIAESIGRDFRLIMTDWGNQVADSRKLADDLGVSDLIRWIEPLPRARLVAMQKSIDLVCDQIALPHFGSTAPEAIAAGVPVIMSYNPASTEWLVDEPAPILSAWTVEEIVKQVQVALDPVWRAEYERAARRWVDRCHNTRIVVEGHLAAYQALLPVPR